MRSLLEYGTLAFMELEDLKQHEFDRHVQNGTLRLSFVGMSNAGKSYRSRKLRDELDFIWHHVDGEIQKSLGFSNMDEISKWLGYPDSPSYGEREQEYLRLENKHSHVGSLNTLGKNLVFDTTGSFVYLPTETLSWLRENCLIVHLDVGESATETLIERFFTHPKPVVWNGMYQDETDRNIALRKSYPRLLDYRLQKYRDASHLNLPAEAFRDTSANTTLSIIKKHLPK